MGKITMPCFYGFSVDRSNYAKCTKVFATPINPEMCVEAQIAEFGMKFGFADLIEAPSLKRAWLLNFEQTKFEEIYDHVFIRGSD